MRASHPLAQRVRWHPLRATAARPCSVSVMDSYTVDWNIVTALAAVASALFAGWQIRESKGADKGIDGRLFWHEGDGKTRQLIISVKAGKLHRSQVHELGGVIGREKAEIGVLLSFDEPTRPMREEAASAGFHASAWGKHARIQLLTVAELLAGKGIDYPRTAGSNVTLKAAPKARQEEVRVFELDFAAPPLRKVAEPKPGGYPASPKARKKRPEDSS